MSEILHKIFVILVSLLMIPILFILEMTWDSWAKLWKGNMLQRLAFIITAPAMGLMAGAAILFSHHWG